MIDVHNYAVIVAKQREKISTTDMLEENKKLILQFLDFCSVDSTIGLARQRLYAYTLKYIGTMVTKSFKLMTEEDLFELLAKLNNATMKKNGQKYSEQTLADFRKAISKFWRWLYYNEYHGDAPPMIKRIKVRSTPNNHKEPEIYTRDEIKKILDGMVSIRDKCFFWCLYDLQCRVSELLSREMCHVDWKNPEGEIRILIEAEKTKRVHTETLYESSSIFTTWLRLHPAVDDPEAPLWTLMRRDTIKPLTYARALKVFKNVCRKQGIRIGKKNTIHMLRKSKASHDLADGVPISYIESRGSWSKGSTALQQCYFSVQNADKDNAYRKKYSMKINGNNNTEKKVIQECKRCNSPVEEDSKFCARCGMPTSIKVIIEKQENEQAIIEVLKNNPDLLSKLLVEMMQKQDKSF